MVDSVHHIDMLDEYWTRKCIEDYLYTKQSKKNNNISEVKEKERENTTLYSSSEHQRYNSKQQNGHHDGSIHANGKGMNGDWRKKETSNNNNASSKKEKEGERHANNIHNNNHHNTSNNNNSTHNSENVEYNKNVIEKRESMSHGVAHDVMDDKIERSEDENENGDNEEVPHEDVILAGYKKCDICIDVDMSYRPFGDVLHLGAHRTSIRCEA